MEQSNLPKSTRPLEELKSVHDFMFSVLFVLIIVFVYFLFSSFKYSFTISTLFEDTMKINAIKWLVSAFAGIVLAVTQLMSKLHQDLSNKPYEKYFFYVISHFAVFVALGGLTPELTTAQYFKITVFTLVLANFENYITNTYVKKYQSLKHQENPLVVKMETTLKGLRGRVVKLEKQVEVKKVV